MATKLFRYRSDVKFFCYFISLVVNKFVVSSSSCNFITAAVLASGKYLALYVIKENGIFIIIVNYMYTDPDITKTIKILKLCWTGHMRMPEENPVMKHLTKTRGK